jgi:hypothetical protein
MEHLEHITELSDRSVAMQSTSHVVSSDLHAAARVLACAHNHVGLGASCVHTTHQIGAHQLGGMHISMPHVNLLPGCDKQSNRSTTHILHVCHCCYRASREFSIEKALDKMMADWEGLTFELGTWKNTGTFILKGEHYAHASDAQHSDSRFRSSHSPTAHGWLVAPRHPVHAGLSPAWGHHV